MWQTRIFITILKGYILLVSLGMSSGAYAACGGPAGATGELKWIAPQLKFCNGSAWVNVNDTATGMGCSTAGQISFVSGEIMYCNGSVWVKTAPPTNYGGCTTTTPGYYYYDTGGTFYWFCNGSNWRRMGP